MDLFFLLDHYRRFGSWEIGDVGLGCSAENGNNLITNQIFDRGEVIVYYTVLYCGNDEFSVNRFAGTQFVHDLCPSKNRNSCS